MVSERLKTLFGKVKNELDARLKEIKHEDIAKFAAKEAAGAIPFVGQIIKDAIDEFSQDEKEELIKELKELSESQFKEISEKVGVSVEYLKDIQKFALYSFKELRTDHEEIKELLLRLVKIQTRGVELKQPEINIPTIQSTLRKEETAKGDFFKKEPEWIDFEEDFVVERKEVDEIIKKSENDDIQLVLGEPASGKSVILKNIGFKLAKKNKDVYIVELKKHSSAEVKRYFDDIPEIKDEKVVFIVDDAHLLPTECERLVREFKNRKLKAKLIIGSRETREIPGEHPKEALEFEYLRKTYIHAKDVAEEMIKSFLKGEHKKYNFSDERIKKISKNLGEYKKDLWFLSWALKAYKPEKDSIEMKDLYEKISSFILNVPITHRKYIKADDVLFPLSCFYLFEIPIEKKFLCLDLKMNENTINKLVNAGEIVENNGMISLHHASLARLYFEAFNEFEFLGWKIKEFIKKKCHLSKGELNWGLYHLYLLSEPRNCFDVISRITQRVPFFGDRGEYSVTKCLLIGSGPSQVSKWMCEVLTGSEKYTWKNGKARSCEIKNMPEDVKTALLESSEKEEDIGKVVECTCLIYKVNEELSTDLLQKNFDRIEKEVGIENILIGNLFRKVSLASEKIGIKLISVIKEKLEKQESLSDFDSMLFFYTELPKENEVPVKLVESLDVDILKEKIEKEINIEVIESVLNKISLRSEEFAVELLKTINIDTLKEKIKKEGDIKKIGNFIGTISLINKKVGIELFKIVKKRIEKEEDIVKFEEFIHQISIGNEKLATELIDLVKIKIKRENNFSEIDACLDQIFDRRQFIDELTDFSGCYSLTSQIYRKRVLGIEHYVWTLSEKIYRELWKKYYLLKS